MAKKKKKKGGAKPRAAEASPIEETDEPAVSGEGEEEEDAEPEGEAPEEEDEAAEEPAAAAPARTEKPTVNLRRGTGRTTEDVDGLVPSPDGPRVSNKGGLIFIAVVLVLMGLAIAAQFAIGS